MNFVVVIVVLLAILSSMVVCIDYCTGLDNVAGIPHKKPLNSVIESACHGKFMIGWNLIAIVLNMSVQISTNIPNENVDIAWGCFKPIETPNNRLTILGPEFDIFPGDKAYSGWSVERYSEGHAVYVALSDWNIDVHAGMGGWKYPMVSFKYPVDVEKFSSSTPKSERKGGFVYFKRRQPHLFEQVKSFLTKKGFDDVSYFHYVNRYQEAEYLAKLKTSAWGVWIGQHESQGFALQEALSMGVPLIVLDATSMRDEGGGCPGGPWCSFASTVNLNATSVTSWSPSCGEVVSDYDSFVARWDIFQNKIAADMYNPRHLIMNSVAPIPSAARLMQLYNYHRNNWCEQYLISRDGGKPKVYWQMSIPICHYDCMDGRELF